MRPASTSRGALACALLAALLAGCSDRISLPDVPEEVRWVALAERGEGGEILAVSPLYRYAPGEPVGLYSRSERPLVLGFDGAVTPVAEAAGSSVSKERLRSSSVCEERLPEAVWWASANPDADLGAPPPLTAGWLAGRCEPLGPEDLRVEVDCTPIVCASAPSWSTPCRGRVPLTACDLEPLEIVRSPFGAPCAVVPESWDCVPNEAPPAFSSVSLTCKITVAEERKVCGVNVFERSSASPFPLDGAGLDRASVVDVPNPEAPEGVIGERELDPEHFHVGAAWGLAVVSGQVWVSHRRGAGGNVDCHAPEARPPSSITRLDADSLQPLGTVDAPPCLQGLVDAGAGFGVFAREDAPGWWLGRFDALGVLEASVQVPHSVPTTQSWVAGVLAYPERGSVVVVTSRYAPAELRISEFDLEALALVATSTRGPGAVHRVDRVDAESFVGGVNQDQWFMARYALDAPVVRSEEIVRPMFRGNMVINGVHFHEASGRVGFTLGRDETSVRAWDPPGFSRADFYERITQGAAIGPWPKDPQRLLCTGVTPGEDGVWRGVIQLFDPVAGTLLPGSRLVGDSVVSEVVEDGQGRLFLLLPWSGEVVRLTP